MFRNYPIGIFDSGLGGLTVFKAIKSVLPNEHIIYLADTKRMPYGNLDPESIIQCTKEAIDFFQAKQVKMVVLACHTVSSVFDQDCGLPVLNLVDIGIRAMNCLSKKMRVAILGTEQTIRSRIYEKKMNISNPNLEIVSVASSTLASFIEMELPLVENEVKQLLNQTGEVNAVFLACTHYPLARPIFEKWMRKDIILIDPAAHAASGVQEFLVENELLSEGLSRSSFFVTDKADYFSQRASRFLEETIQAKHVNLIEENPCQKV